MNKKSTIPLSAISKGRDLGTVLSNYMEFHKGATAEMEKHGLNGEQAFVNAMQGALYRLYLLGVEDGMKGGE